MALYIMVRHRRDKRSNRYRNVWHDDVRLASIVVRELDDRDHSVRRLVVGDAESRLPR